VLETTLATRFVPGSNVKGEVVGANWRFLLPRLRHGLAVVYGTPSRAALAGLRSASDELVVVPNGSAAEVEPGSADIVLVSDARVTPAEVERVLHPDGSVWQEPASAAGGVPVWLSPPAGEIGALAPLADDRTIAYLRRHAKLDPAVRRLSPALARRWLRDHASPAALRRRTGSLSGPHPSDRPPAYLHRLVRVAGLDPETARWGIVVPGQYSSKKVLAFLFAPDGTTPTAIVKLTRSPEFNGRLENEFGALQTLARRNIGPAGAIPRALGLESEGGLVLVAESAEDGVPFRLRSSGRADCALLRQADTLLLELGAAAAGTGPVPAIEAANVFGELVERLAGVYALTPAHEAFLHRQVETIATASAPFPVVFQHGDPGIWNLLATRAGGISLLDWEAAEEQGVPLWDLFYFWRSYAALSGGRRARGLLGPPELATGLVSSVEAHCEQTALPRELVEPLYYLCWVHRALKEATRRSPERLESGHFVTLLRRAIDAHGTDELSRLFAVN